MHHTVHGMTHEQHCAAIVTWTGTLSELARAADPTTEVPTCPGWNLAQLVRHVGAGHRWVETIVRTAAPQPPPDTALRELSPRPYQDREELAEWLTTGAAELAEALRAAGPEAAMFTAVPGRTARFWARRFAHETVVHTADAALALGAPFDPAPEIATDCVDEWLELLALPQQLDADPAKRELLGPARVLRLRATDQADADWIVDLTGEAITWQRPAGPTVAGGGEVAVTIAGRLAELVLLLYRRRPPTTAGDGQAVSVTGDHELLDFWLKRVGFG